jgi:hypothetical protein
MTVVVALTMTRLAGASQSVASYTMMQEQAGLNYLAQVCSSGGRGLPELQEWRIHLVLRVQRRSSGLPQYSA